MADTETLFPQPFLSDVLHGLSLQQKSVPARYFYDERGSELFEEITRLPEYYLTRTELALLEAMAPEIAAVIGSDASIVEYGAGALRKIRLLLDALPSPSAYIPVDVSGDFLRDASAELRTAYPSLSVRPVVGSFLSEHLQIVHPPEAKRHIAFFPGSTLGNLTDDAIYTFLTLARSHLTRERGFLLGVDISQDPAKLIPAYNDAAGVTAAFNLNLLTRINRELSGDFVPDRFRHEARWNAARHQIEMHLVSRTDQTVHVAGETFRFTKDESLHTEVSRKFTPDMLETLTRRAGWTLSRVWTSPDETMGLFWLT